MTDKQPDPLALADEAWNFDCSEYSGARAANAAMMGKLQDCATMIRRLHAENEAMRTGYEAARLEIESLRARSLPEIKGMHNGPQQLNLSDRAMWALGWNECRDAMRAAQPVVAQQPGAAYAAPQFPAHPEPMVMDWSAIEISVIAQYGRDMYEAGKRQSHGQASRCKGAAGECDFNGACMYACGQAPAQPVAEPAKAIMPKGESAAAQLRAMATNYPAGHLWDKLDAKACIRGALEIEALRASHGQAPASKIEGLTAAQEPLGAEFEKVLHDNLFDLYEESPQTARLEIESLHGQQNKDTP